MDSCNIQLNTTMPKQHRALEIPSAFCITSLRVYNKGNLEEKSNNNPCELLRGGIYRNAHTKYLKRYIMSKMNTFTDFTR